ncbi:MAG: antirestriction protein ArdA [Pseudomonadota bacterium]
MSNQTGPSEQVENAEVVPAGGEAAGVRAVVKTVTPKIWVGCWAAYNAGRLHGRWIEVTDVGEIWDEVRAMLAASPAPGAEEWGIFDYQGFEGAEVSEQADFAHVCQLAEFIGEHGPLGGKLLEHFGQNLNEAKAAFEDYAGEYKNLADFAAEFTEETGVKIPESLSFYINYDALGRDMELGGDVYAIETGFEEAHIFWSR